MTLFVKICGLRTPEDVAAAAAAGADAVGFVLAESPRRVTPREARELAEALPPGIQPVAVMRSPQAADWAAVAAEFQPNWLQADAPALAAMGLLGGDDGVLPSVRPLPVFRDTPDLDEEAVAAAGLVLFEAAESGRGIRPDWQRAARLARRCRLVLAGGLDPDNVAEAIRTVRPFGVDVSSGVERSRGVKDPARIAAFVAAARAAQ
jgi:phosphoribosylanthranilate isomerase